MAAQHETKPAETGNFASNESRYDVTEGKRPSSQEVTALLAVFGQGRAFESERAARIMTARYPDCRLGWEILAAAHYNVGKALCDQGRWDEAEARFRNALQIEPDFFAVHLRLGILFKTCGRLAEARACFQKALDLSPQSADVHCDLGSTLQELGRLREAQACFEQALSIKPDHADAIVGLGDVAGAQGRFAEAESCYSRALGIQPNKCSALAALVQVRRMGKQDGAWLTKAEAMLNQGMSAREESFLRYAMGKYFNDLEDFDRAFQNYFRANELSKPYARPYDKQQQTLVVDQLRQAYGRETVRRAHAGASDSVRPLFIVGMPRSGTSLIEQIIASHPRAYGAGELTFWGEVLKHHASAVFSAQLDEALIRTITEACLGNLAVYSGDALRVADKMPVNFSILGLIHAVFPNARILHARRDPLDTCLSIYFQNFSGGYAYANDLADVAHYYGEYHRLMEHWRAVLPDGAMLEVPYESLVEEPEYWSRKIIDFSGLEWDERCLEFHKTERGVATSSKWQVRQPIYKTSTARWRRYEKHIGPLRELMSLR